MRQEQRRRRGARPCRARAASGGRSRSRHAAASSSATTNMYELASGERNVDTSRRSGMLVAGVVEEVLGQAREALVVEAELLA